MAALVRVDGLVAGSADRVRGHEAVGHHPGVDHRAQVLGREAASVAHEPAAADAAGFERLDPRQEARLRGAQRRLDRAYLARLLQLALRPEGLGTELEPDSLAAELLREPEREAARHAHPPQAQEPQHARDHVGRGRAAAALLERRRDLGPRQHAIDGGLAARAVHLEVAHHEDARPALLDEEERVGREEARRIEDVGVGLGGGVDQPARGRLRHLRCRRRR